MPNKPIYLDELLDRAKKETGSDTKLAAFLDVKKQAVSDWRHGRKPCPPADQALLAYIAGLSADDWAARALISQHEGTEKGELLKQALKKALQATGAAMLSGSANAAQVINAAHDGLLYLIRCITCTPHRVLFQPAR
jgi:hypothetical protein